MRQILKRIKPEIAVNAILKLALVLTYAQVHLIAIVSPAERLRSNKPNNPLPNDRRNFSEGEMEVGHVYGL